MYLLQVIVVIVIFILSLLHFRPAAA